VKTIKYVKIKKIGENTLPNITISLPRELYNKMKKHPEIKWSVVIRQYLEKFINRLETKHEEKAEELLERLNIEEELEKIPDEKTIEYSKKMVKKRAKRIIRH